MAQDPGLAFAQNLVNRYMQFKALQFQATLAERQERRYEKQLQENRLYRQQRLDLERHRITTQEERYKTTQAAIESRFSRGQELTREGMEALEKRFFAGQELTREQMAALAERFEAGQALTREGMEATRLWRQQKEEQYLTDPRRAFAADRLAFVRDPETTPQQRAAAFGGGTTINISAGEREKTAESLATIDILGNLKDLYDNVRTRTGPVVGRLDPIIGQLGWTSTEQEDFMAATSAFKNKIIKEITGAQMSEAEAFRIMKQVPDIIDHPDRWEAKWRQSVQNIQYLQKRRQEIQGGRTPTPWTSPSEEPFGPRIIFPTEEQPQIDLSGIDALDLEGLFK